MNSLINGIGDELSRIGGGNTAVKTYWTNFATTTYQDCIDFLDNWTGLPYPQTTSSNSNGNSTANAVVKMKLAR